MLSLGPSQDLTCPRPPTECPLTLSQSSGDTNGTQGAGNSSGSALTLPVSLHMSLSPRASPDASLWAPRPKLWPSNGPKGTAV